MNAITMLKHQHREVEALFNQMHKARTGSARRAVFERIADALAVHSAIEERHFYPSVKERSTETILLESLEEHLAIKRVIADLLQLDAGNGTFPAKVKVLEDEVLRHVEEEEAPGGVLELARSKFDNARLDLLAKQMQELKRSSSEELAA